MRAWSGSSMILWFVLRFGIYFLRAGNVSDGQIANWRASCVNPLILVSPMAVCAVSNEPEAAATDK